MNKLQWNLKFIYFHSRKYIWNGHLENGGHFFLGLNVLRLLQYTVCGYGQVLANSTRIHQSYLTNTGRHMASGFSPQRGRNVESVSMSWRRVSKQSISDPL